jgi:tetratricopeptide (TPR) repeat protein
VNKITSDAIDGWLSLRLSFARTFSSQYETLARELYLHRLKAYSLDSYKFAWANLRLAQSLLDKAWSLTTQDEPGEQTVPTTVEQKQLALGEALALALRALEKFRVDEKRNASQVIASTVLAGKLYYALGNFSNAAEFFEKAVLQCETNCAEDYYLITALDMLTSVYRNQGRVEEARAAEDRCKKLVREVSSTPSFGYRAYNTFGWFMSSETSRYGDHGWRDR